MPILIIAEIDSAGHWSAWVENNPCTAFGGNAPAVAVERLLEFASLDPMGIHADCSRSSLSRQVFIHGGEPCPDCSGSGRYVGFNSVEDCLGCSGSGVV